MDIRTQVSLLAGVVSFALAGSTFLRPQGRGGARVLFALLSLSLGAWYIADFLALLSSRPLWPRLGLAAGSLVPLAAASFLGELLALRRPVAARAQEAATGVAVVGLAVAATPLFRVPFAEGAVAVLAFGSLAATLFLVFEHRRAALAIRERERLFYLLAGAATAVLVSGLDFIARLGHPWPTLGGVATVLYLFFLAQTLERDRLLDLPELLGKAASISALGLMLALVYGGIGYWLKDRPGLFLFNTVIASFVVLSLYEPLRAKVEEWVVVSLFRERFELIRQLGELRGRLSPVLSPPEMAGLACAALESSRRVTHTSVYLLAEDRPGFRLLDHRGPNPVPFLDAGAARGLLAAASGGERALLSEVVDRRLAEIARAAGSPDPEAARLENVKAAMGKMRAGITFPLVGGDRVLGFWNLWDDRVPEAYGSDEIAAMIEVAEQAAAVLESSQLFERMKERDRLAALGEMAAGLAHEIRNPLGAIKGAAQYLHPRETAGHDGELLSVIVEEVDRLNGVVTEFLDYSRPVKSQLAPTDVNEVVARTVKLLQSQGVREGIAIELRLSADMPPAIGDAEQLKHVFINLALNAIQAMPRGGTLTILTVEPAWRFADVARKLRGPDLVEIRFRDTGEGISPEARDRIFIPFYTTKEKGTGLGLAIVQRIVKAHNGSISVDSEPGHGTEFVVRLPAATDLTPVPAGRPETGEPLLTDLAAGGRPAGRLDPARLPRRERQRRKRSR